MNLNFLAQNISNNEDNNSISLCESSIAQTEKKLILELFDNLKDSQNFINIDNLFTFLLAILNLYEVYLLKNHEENSNINDEDEDNNFIIPIMSSRVIFKDFNLFYLNLSNLTYINRKKKKTANKSEIH